jgi:hypothetical protein
MEGPIIPRTTTSMKVGVTNRTIRLVTDTTKLAYLPDEILLPQPPPLAQNCSVIPLGHSFSRRFLAGLFIFEVGANKRDRMPSTNTLLIKGVQI